jgi:hypothetical protein
MNLTTIPNELRELRQWVTWRYIINDGVATKVPFNARTGQTAAIDDPSSWSDFETVCAKFLEGGESGIMLALTEHDPFAVADLDDPKGDPQVIGLYDQILTHFDSYAEVSPSGKGGHIFVKGHVPRGLKRSHVEVYSSKRFISVTGDCFNGKPIAERQAWLDYLWNQLGGRETTTIETVVSTDAKDGDEAVMQRCAMHPTMGELFRELWVGNWQGKTYPSQSEADQALANLIAFQTDNVEQCERIWRQSSLAQREKAKTRPDYVKATIAKSFDQKFVTTAADNYRLAMAEKLKVRAEAEVEPKSEIEEAIGDHVPTVTFPPGLVGEIAQFIYQASPRPIPEVSLIAAIGMMAGICGRQFNVNGAGLNQYLLLLATSGSGKEQISRGMDKLIHAVSYNPPGTTLTAVPGISTFIGPGEIVSAPALLKRMQEHPCFVSVFGEFGLYLKNLSDERASITHSLLKRAFLDIYNKSGRGQSAKEIVYSKKEENTLAVVSPALTILGETTQATFHSVVDETLIEQGLLPRFLTIEYPGGRVPNNKGAAFVKPSQELVDKLRGLAGRVLEMMAPSQAPLPPKPPGGTIIDVEVSPEAEALLDAFDKFADSQMNSTAREAVKQLWNRAHLKALKLSALVEVGLNWMTPRISYESAKWATELVASDIQRMLHKFEIGAVGKATHEIQQSEEIKRTVREYLKADLPQVIKYGANREMHGSHIIPYSYVLRKNAAVACFRHDRLGSTNAIKRTIQTFIDAGYLIEYDRAKLQSNFGTAARAFVASDPAFFGI